MNVPDMADSGCLVELGRCYGGAGVEVSDSVGLWRRDFKLLGRRGRDCSVDGGACYEIYGCERPWRGSFRYSTLLSIGFFPVMNGNVLRLYEAAIMV